MRVSSEWGSTASLEDERKHAQTATTTKNFKHLSKLPCRSLNLDLGRVPASRTINVPMIDVKTVVITRVGHLP